MPRTLLVSAVLGVGLAAALPLLGLVSTGAPGVATADGNPTAAPGGDAAARPGAGVGETEAGAGGGGGDAAEVDDAARLPTTGATHRLDPALEVARRGGDAAFSSGRSAFALTVDGQRVDYHTLAVVVLPGETVEVEVEDAGATAFRLVHGSGHVTDAGPARWRWTPPGGPGIVPLRVERVEGSQDAGGAAVHLNALVAHPRDRVRDGSLGGYRIGHYRETPLRGDPAYLPPAGFVEVVEADHDVLVSPHFTLGQFLCKQPGEPRYLALSPPLLRKLEAVLEATNRAGYDVPTFHVMSGYRTPAYNRAIGNTTDASRHLWGDAADIFVDIDGDGDMDDLDGDGRSDLADARILYGIVEGVERRAAVRAGGLGLYRRNAAHGPFVHVDARGHAARW